MKPYLNNKIFREAPRHSLANGILTAALIFLSYSTSHAGLLDKIVKIERTGDSVGIGINPLGFLGGDKRQQPDNAAVVDQPATENPQTTLAPSQTGGFTQARLADGTIHLAFIQSPELRTAKNSRGYSNLPLFTEMTGGTNFYNSVEVRSFLLAHHGFLPSSAVADPIGYLISQSDSERIRFQNLNEFEQRDEAFRIRAKFEAGLEKARGIDRGMLFVWNAQAGKYDFDRKGFHFSGGWPGNIFIDGVEVGTIFFPVSEVAARASVERKEDRFIMKLEGRIMDKDDFPQASPSNLGMSVPLALSKASLYLVRRRADGKTVPEFWHELNFNASKSAITDVAPSPSADPVARQGLARDSASRPPASIQTPLSIAPLDSTPIVQTDAGQTSREFVETAAWAEFKQTWRLEGEAWVASSTIIPEAFDVKSNRHLWMVSLVSDPGSGCELRNVQFEIEERPVSELERMNGLTERWFARFVASYYRTKTAAGWSRWQSPSYGGKVLSLRFESRDGGKLTMLNRTPVWQP